jgi:hypothetical protein
MVDDVQLSRLEERLLPLLSVIAGMVDLTRVFTLGNVFTAHDRESRGFSLTVKLAGSSKGSKPNTKAKSLDALFPRHQNKPKSFDFNIYLKDTITEEGAQSTLLGPTLLSKGRAIGWCCGRSGCSL